MKKAGHADLPLHHGHVPEWLASRMSKLGKAIVETIVLEYGKKAVIQKLSDPLWFQSFGAVMGMDWHSSGITTSVIGALKRGINPIAKDLGIHICGGRGKHSRKTPAELVQVGYQTGLNGFELARCSRLSAKVDNTAIQDGYQIYLHSFIVSDEGDWSVVQQGMNKHNGMARRYHWHSADFTSFVENPHTWVLGKNEGLILNLTDVDAKQTKTGVMDIAQEHPTKIITEARKILMPRHHEVKIKDVDLKRLGAVIALANERAIPDFESLLLVEGLGPRTLQSLVLVSEVIHGTTSRFKDPARFSFAHGGKDGFPFPVPTKVYDQVIDQMDQIVQKSKIGLTDKQKALKRLHTTAKKIEEDFVPNNNFELLVEEEWKNTNLFGGRTVFDDRPRRSKRKNTGQLNLFGAR